MGLLISTGVQAPAVADHFPPVQTSERVVRYPIAGESVSALRMQLENHGPLAAEPGHGRTRSELEILSELEPAADGCHLVALEIRLQITTTLPEWKPAHRAAAELHNHWSEAIAMLERHEMGHRDHVLTAADALRQTVLQLAPQTDCFRMQWAIDRHFQRTMWKLRMRGERYDRRTRNGLRDDPLQDPEDPATAAGRGRR